MLFTWFWLVAIMITGYVVLDGFDLGAGVIHLFIAKTDQERRMVLRTVGPVWDGNEVWLVAGGGTLYFAFPLLYASGFSGFYLPLMIVLWLLILRGVGIELRTHLDSPVWRGFFDGCFGISSILLTVFFGAALGNVIRGVPLQKDGYFFLPLWTNWNVGSSPGVLDWYTVITGLVALVALTMHGAHYVAMKTAGVLNARSRRIASFLWPVLVLLTLISLFATLSIHPGLLDNYKSFLSSTSFPWQWRRRCLQCSASDESKMTPPRFFHRPHTLFLCWWGRLPPFIQTFWSPPRTRPSISLSRTRTLGGTRCEWVWCSGDSVWRWRSATSCLFIACFAGR